MRMSVAKKSEMIKQSGPTARDFDLESDGSGRVSRHGSVLLSQVAHQRLRHDVIAGVLRPNQRLVELELSEQLGMSRTPVRDALVLLAADGLVERGNHGWTVHEYTREELVSIYEVRGALEGYAANLSALRATEEELEGIETMLELERGELDPISPDSSVDLNIEFHAEVVNCCGNPRLIELAERSAGFYFNSRVASTYTEKEY